MVRIARHLLLALALLFSQQAAQLHAFAHVKRDLAAALGEKKNLPPVGHPAEQCLAFHALDNVLADTVQPVIARCGLVAQRTGIDLPRPVVPLVAFDSCAPPVHS